MLFVCLLIVALVSFAEEASIEVSHENRKFKAVAVWQVPEGVDPAKKGAVIWVHGLLQTHRMREPVTVQREIWVGAGFPVLSPTLTLRVNSRREPYDCSYPLDTEFEESLREIGAWVEWLKRKGVKRIVLAGHSLGGLQVVLFASKVRDPAVVGVVAVAPSKGIKREHPLIGKAEDLVKKGKGTKMLRTSFFYCQEAEVSARTLYSYYGVDRNLGKALRKVDVPVLIVWGAMDERVKDLPTFLDTYIKDKGNVRVEVIDFADHFFRDLAAEDLGNIVVEFLREVLP